MKKYLLFLLASTLLFACKSNNVEEGEKEDDYSDLAADELIVSTNFLTCDCNAADLTFTVVSGSKWSAALELVDPTLDQTPDWIVLTNNSGQAKKKYTVNVKITANTSPGPREYRIVVSNKEGDEDLYIDVTQDAHPCSDPSAYLLSDKVVGSVYPSDCVGEKTTVESEIMDLYFYGYTQSGKVYLDKRFYLDFPTDDAYNRLIMTYRMGANSLGAYAWDYNVNIAFLYNGEWFEVANTITPYGNSFGSDFEKKFYFDMTEYLPMLKGHVEFKIYYGGWNNVTERCHTAQLTFDLYKGERDRNQVYAYRLYDSEEYDNASDSRCWWYGREVTSIEKENRFSSRTITVPSNVKTLEMKVVMTGHGADQGSFPDRSNYQTLNAAEFDYNYYTVKINEVPCAQKGYIFVPCSNNYKQAGTYYYDRANWCPGNPAHIDKWRFVNIKGGDTFDIDFDLERFISQFQSGNWAQAKYRVHVDLFGFDN